MPLQQLDVRGIHQPRGLRQLLSKLQCIALGICKTREVATLERLPIFRGYTNSLRRSEMMLQSIVALVEHRHAYVDELVQFAIQAAACRRVESQECRKSFGLVRHDFVHVARLPAQTMFVDLLHFRARVLRFDVGDSWHCFLPYTQPLAISS